MAASKSRTHPVPSSREAPFVIETSLKTRKPRKAKAKDDRLHSEITLVPNSKLPFVDSAWSWTSITDFVASTHPAVFTKDGSYFFSIVGSSVKIHASSTGRIVSTLSSSLSGSSSACLEQDHKDIITSAILNPRNPFQLITASLDGCIKIWDYLEAVLLQTIDIEQPIVQMTAHEKFKDCVFAAVSRATKKKNSNGNPIEDNALVVKVSLTPTTETAQSSVHKSSEIRSIGKTRPTAGLTVSSSGTWLVAIAGHKAYVAKTSQLKSGFTKFVSPEKLTCLAIHPNEEYFATGDAKGNIKLWYCLHDGIFSNASGVEKRAQTTSFHWHAHAVSSISFTPNGAYLLSGGEEAVLVIWQLHTGKREFVPRVGAPISSISVSPASEREEEYLLGLADATHAFVSSGSLRLSRSFSRIKLDPIYSSDVPSTSTSIPLAVHPLTASLILPSSHPSSLQTYSPSTFTLLSEIEVSPSNRVSRRDDKHLEPFRVQQTVVSKSGEWMATVDVRQVYEPFRAEAYLKIWYWDQKAGFWILNTRVDRPHGPKKITSISFSPDHSTRTLQLVTAGEDHQIKSWSIRQTKDKNGRAEEFWVPRSTFGFRSESPSHISYSADGSLLAISLGPYVPLYDPLTNTLRQVITCSECNHVSSSYFLGKRGRYLAVAGKRDLVLWDLLSQSVRWHYQSNVDIDHIIPHPSDDTLAMLQASASSAESKALLFRSESAIPYKVHTIPFRLSSVVWYPTPFQSSKFNLVGITHSWNVMLFGDDLHYPSEGDIPSQIDPNDNSAPQKPTIFQEMFGISAFSNFKPIPSSSSSLSPRVIREGRIPSSRSVFDAPAYLMPPLESFFDLVIGEFLHARSESEDAPTTTKAQGVVDHSDDMDVDAEAESESHPFIVGNTSERTVVAQEMNDFVELFRHYCLTASSTRRPSTHSNGVTKQNGVSDHEPVPDGIGSIPVHKFNGVDASATSPTPTLSTTVSRKRKKSLEDA